MSPRPSSGSLHIGVPSELDLSLIVRGVTASLVVWWHTWGYKLAMPDLAFLYVPGRIAVFMFFIISGYVITAGFADGRYGGKGSGFRVFWRNRFLRIYPLFLAVSIASLVILAARGTPLPITPGFVLRELLMLQWWHTYRLVGVFWTLGVEMQFYVVVPFLFALQWTGGPNLRRGLILYALLLVYPMFAHYAFGAWWDNRTLLGNLMHFQAGALLNHLRPWITERAARTRMRVPLMLIAFAAAAIMGASYFDNRRPDLFWHGPGLLLVDGAGLALLVAHRLFEEWRVGLNPVTRGLSLLGVLSYGLYAWHGLVLTYFPWFLDRFAPTLAASLALAAIGYVLIERPCLRLKSTGIPRGYRAQRIINAGRPS